MGRHHTPYALKIANDNPGKRKLVEPPMPQLSKGICPDWLPDGAKEIWNHEVPLMTAIDMFAATDESLMAFYCMNVYQLQEILKALGNNAPNNVDATLIHKMQNLVLKTGAELGLSCTSREKLGTRGADVVNRFKYNSGVGADGKRNKVATR